MGQRTELHAILADILGSSAVYFQPPETIKIKYPCIIYERSYNDVRFADNNPYSTKHRYTLTVIDKNPDSELPDKIAALPMCRSNRMFTNDNLNHYVFDIYY